MNRQSVFSIAAVLSVVLACVLVSPAPAAVIYSSFGPNDSFSTGQSYAITGRDVQQGVAYDCANCFVPTSDYFFDRAELEVTNVKQTIHINLQLMTDANGLPGTLIEGMTIAIDNLSSDASAYWQLVSADSAAHPRLVAGQRYWLAAIPGTDTTWTSWCENSIGRVGIALQGDMYNPPNRAWRYSQNSPQGAFRVSGTVAPVPEPSSILALIAGLAGIGGTAIRRRK